MSLPYLSDAYIYTACMYGVYIAEVQEVMYHTARGSFGGIVPECAAGVKRGERFYLSTGSQQ